MDESVIRGIARWPNVPAVYGWLALDRRGRWLLRGEQITHPLSIGFINRNYTHDEQGRWFFQNGPQRVFVDLHCTPWILRASPDGELKTHTDLKVNEVREAFLDEDGHLLLLTEHGPGLVNDRDLDVVETLLTSGEGKPLTTFPDNETIFFNSCGKRIAVEEIGSSEIGARLGFEQNPQEGDPSSRV